MNSTLSKDVANCPPYSPKLPNRASSGRFETEPRAEISKNEAFVWVNRAPRWSFRKLLVEQLPQPSSLIFLPVSY